MKEMKRCRLCGAPVFPNVEKVDKGTGPMYSLLSCGWKHLCFNAQKGETRRITRLCLHPSTGKWHDVDEKHVVRGLDRFMHYTK